MESTDNDQRPHHVATTELLPVETITSRFMEVVVRQLVLQVGTELAEQIAAALIAQSMDDVADADWDRLYRDEVVYAGFRPLWPAQYDVAKVVQRFDELNDAAAAAARALHDLTSALRWLLVLRDNQARCFEYQMDDVDRVSEQDQ